MDQRIVPMLSYEDGHAALDWLVRAFGFTEKERWSDDDGRLTHGEAELAGQVVMLAAPTPLYESPKTLAEKYPPAKAWQEVPYIFDGVLVLVDDVDAHFRQAQECGATILSPLEDGFPGRRYRAADPEGHRWFFMQASD